MEIYIHSKNNFEKKGKYFRYSLTSKEAHQPSGIPNDEKAVFLSFSFFFFFNFNVVFFD